jgi:MerR family transcriptional regulator, thiopeptide resistance regulator
VGLLSPAQVTEAGYRLYAEEDLFRLQQILALKFLGFSLEEIKAFLKVGPQRLPEVLAQQKAMMREKRCQLDSILHAIEETEAVLQTGHCSWEAIARVIQAIQMEQKTDWIKKHFTEEQLKKMEELGQSAYSQEAREKLGQRGEWTEQDQEKASAQWTHVYAEARRLAAAGADPAGAEAQAVAKLKCDLLSAFTQGDPEIKTGLNRWWEQFNALPAAEKPFDPAPFDAGVEGNKLLEQAIAIYQRGT